MNSYSLQTNKDYVSYDNPLSLANLSASCIVRNIENFVNREFFSGKEFYLWKDGLLLPDCILEQILLASYTHCSILSTDAWWLTLFLGSRRRARQFINILVNLPSAFRENSDGVYKDKYAVRAQQYAALGSVRLLNFDYLPVGVSSLSSNSSDADSQIIMLNPSDESNRISFENRRELENEFEGPNCKRRRDSNGNSPPAQKISQNESALDGHTQQRVCNLRTPLRITLWAFIIRICR